MKNQERKTSRLIELLKIDSKKTTKELVKEINARRHINECSTLKGYEKYEGVEITEVGISKC